MTIPPALMRSAPRPARLSGAGRATLVAAWLVALGSLVGAAFLHVKAGRDAERAQLRASNAVKTEGQIVTVERRKGDKRRWRVAYSFAAPVGNFEGRLVTRQKMEVGTRVDVGYMPGNPADNWIVGREPRGGVFWLAPLAAFGGLSLAAAIAWSVRRQIGLLTSGRAAVATVTGSRKVHHQHGHIHRVSYEFRMLSGALRTGTLDLSKPLPDGTEFVILYDPDRPGRASRYPLRLVHAG